MHAKLTNSRARFMLFSVPTSATPVSSGTSSWVWPLGGSGTPEVARAATVVELREGTWSPPVTSVPFAWVV
jgi:hypothetical protein